MKILFVFECKGKPFIFNVQIFFVKNFKFHSFYYNYSTKFMYLCTLKYMHDG